MPGRPLRDSDISPSLEGQRAEMFWPDDNLWYLVEIATVDMRTHQVRIMYTFISIYDRVARRSKGRLRPLASAVARPACHTERWLMSVGAAHMCVS